MFNINDIYFSENFSLQEVEALTDLCFESKNYFQNFPQVFKQQYAPYFLLLKHESKAVAFCSIFPSIFNLNNMQLQSYCIGSVCTHPEYRNMGLAKRVIELAENRARANCADFVFLFSNNEKFYTKLDYKLADKIYIAKISTEKKVAENYKNYCNLSKHFSKIMLKYSSKNFELVHVKNLQTLEYKDKSHLWEMIIQQSLSSEPIISYLEFCDILKIRNMELYILKYFKNNVAFCFYNKGDDFKFVIHASYCTNNEFMMILLKKIVDSVQQIMFFQGPMYKEYQNVLNFFQLSTMYVKSLRPEIYTSFELKSLCEKNEIFVGSLKGT